MLGGELIHGGLEHERQIFYFLIDLNLVNVQCISFRGRI